MTITSKATGKPVAPPIEKTNTCAPGDIFLVYTQTSFGGPAGPAEAELTLTYGAKTASIKVPLVIQ